MSGTRIFVGTRLGAGVYGGWRRMGRLRRYWVPRIRRGLRWFATSCEIDNYTYPITARNRLHLAHFAAHVTGRPVEEIEGYFQELETDAALRQHVVSRLRSGPWQYISDPRFDPGRRLAWYAIARAMKPEIVVESGCERGFGAVCLISALIRNGRGRYYGLDIDPRAGWLVSGPFAEVGKVVYGDAIESLKALDGPIDIYVNDANHSLEYEAGEYDVVAPKLASDAVIIGDNAHATNALEALSRRTGRRFLYMSDEPANYLPAASIAVAW